MQGSPDLMVEILSESTREWDRVAKREVYSRNGVREYWIMDPQAKTVEVASHNGSELATAGVYTVGTCVVSPLLPDIRVDIGELFRE